MNTLTTSVERYRKYPLNSIQRAGVRMALVALGSIVDILENHEWYGPEWAKVARAVLGDIADYNDDEEEHSHA